MKYFVEEEEMVESFLKFNFFKLLFKGLCIIHKPSWRNWITRPTSNRKILGSSPSGGVFYSFFNYKNIIHF